MMWYGYFFLLALFPLFNAKECDRPKPCTSSLAIAPADTDTGIITSAYCNNSLVEVWWTWNSCPMDIYLIYTCFNLDGKEIIASPNYQNINKVSMLSSHTWRQNISSGVINECEIAGYYVTTVDDCHVLLSPRNITCSVQPTSSIGTTITQTEWINWTNWTKSFTMTTSAVDKSRDLSGTQKVIVIIIACVTVMLTAVVVFLVVMNLLLQNKWKYPMPYNYCDERFDVIEPDYFPVTPDEKVISDDNLSLRSNIQPLQRMEDTIDEYDIATYCIIEDKKATETNKSAETEADKNGIFFESSVHESKSMYSNEEYDMASQTTETMDESINQNFLTPQEYNSECSNCLYVEQNSKVYIEMSIS